MRPAEFTPEQIIEAGQELQAAGRNITGFALRQKVGGDRKSTRLNSSHLTQSRMPSSA